MDDRTPPTPADVARQAAQHAASLRAAGVDWVPVGSAAQARQPSLFAEPAPAAAPPAADAEQRRHSLTLLASEVAACVRCPELASTRTQTVFGVGPLDPDLCFVGEAPGFDEDRVGEPFVGAAGQLLTRIIVAMGLKREEVFICNILRCRPPNNRTPSPEEAGHCSEWLHRTLELVRPKFLCAMGNTPRQHLLGLSGGITKTRGQFYDFKGIPVMLTFHPSYLLREPGKKKEVWEDMKLLLGRMGRPIPGKE